MKPTLHILPTGPFEVNCIIVQGDARRAVVIDPGEESERIDAFLLQRGLDVDAWLLTHGHADHLCALAALHASRPAPVYLHEADQAWAFSQSNQIPPYYPVPGKPQAVILHPGSGVLHAAGIDFECIATPGHSPGSVCYWIRDAAILVSGDTLFKGTCGRTDLPGGNARTLSRSLSSLAALPPETAVYPGHGDPTTIGEELLTNFFLAQHRSSQPTPLKG